MNVKAMFTMEKLVEGEIKKDNKKAILQNIPYSKINLSKIKKLSEGASSSKQGAVIESDKQKLAGNNNKKYNIKKKNWVKVIKKPIQIWKIKVDCLMANLEKSKDIIPYYNKNSNQLSINNIPGSLVMVNKKLPEMVKGDFHINGNKIFYNFNFNAVKINNFKDHNNNIFGSFNNKVNDEQDLMNSKVHRGISENMDYEVLDSEISHISTEESLSKAEGIIQNLKEFNDFNELLEEVNNQLIDSSFIEKESNLFIHGQGDEKELGFVLEDVLNEAIPLAILPPNENIKELIYKEEINFNNNLNNLIDDKEVAEGENYDIERDFLTNDSLNNSGIDFSDWVNEDYTLSVSSVGERLDKNKKKLKNSEFKDKKVVNDENTEEISEINGEKNKKNQNQKNNSQIINLTNRRKSFRLEKKSKGIYSPILEKAMAEKQKKLGMKNDNANFKSSSKNKQPVIKKLIFEEEKKELNENDINEVLQAQGIIIDKEIEIKIKDLIGEKKVN